MRLLFVIGTLQNAGTPTHLVELLRGLDRQRFSIEVCCLQKVGGLVPEVEALGVPVHDLRLPILYHPAFLPRLAALVRHVRRFRPDVVHTYLFSADVFGSLMARLGGAPAVVTSRRMDTSQDAWRRTRAYRVANLWTDRIVTPSEAARQACLRAERVDPAKVLTVYNGIDLRRIDRAAPATDLPQGRGPWIGTVGHLNPIKGHRTLIEAMPAIRARHPEAQLLLIGGGLLRESLGRRVHEVGLGRAVHFLGVRTDVPSVLKRLDLFVQPSDSEGMSNALLEALAAARPVVATRVGGNPEVVRDGVDGLLVPPADPAAMARACGDLLADRARLEAFGREGRRRAEALFTVERMAARMTEVYLGVAGPPGHAEAVGAGGTA